MIKLIVSATPTMAALTFAYILKVGLEPHIKVKVEENEKEQTFHDRVLVIGDTASSRSIFDTYAGCSDRFGWAMTSIHDGNRWFHLLDNNPHSTANMFRHLPDSLMKTVKEKSPFLYRLYEIMVKYNDEPVTDPLVLYAASLNVIRRNWYILSVMKPAGITKAEIESKDYLRLAKRVGLTNHGVIYRA